MNRHDLVRAWVWIIIALMISVALLFNTVTDNQVSTLRNQAIQSCQRGDLLRTQINISTQNNQQEGKLISEIAYTLAVLHSNNKIVASQFNELSRTAFMIKYPTLSITDCEKAYK